MPQVGESGDAEGAQGQAEEADGQQQLGQGHEVLGGEGGPGGASGTETGDEQQVDDHVEHQRRGGEEVQLPQVASGGEEGAEDIGDADGDDAEDDHTEHRHIGREIPVVEQLHDGFRPQVAHHRNTHGKKHHRPENKADNVR